MAELPDDLYAELVRLSQEGDVLAGEGGFAAALACFQAAWELVPEPKTESEASLWLLGAIGDMQFQLGRFEEARGSFMAAMKEHDGALENPFLRLRLGQCLFELGDQREAANWMCPAFLMEGAQLFEGEDAKYLAFIKSQLEPPPEGWPEGW